MWNCIYRVGESKLKCIGTVVKLGRAAGLTGAMHKVMKKNGRDQRRKSRRISSTFFIFLQISFLELKKVKGNPRIEKDGIPHFPNWFEKRRNHHEN